MIRKILISALCAIGFGTAVYAQSFNFVPTAPANDSTNKAASTAFVTGAINSLTLAGIVKTFNGRTGTVLPQNGDYSFSQISGLVAAAQLPFPTTTALGGVVANAGTAGQFVTGINVANGHLTYATPSGGSGSPGGTNGQVQFNNSGAFGGLTNTQLTADINVCTGALSGAVPGTGGGNTTLFLNGNCQFSSPSAGTGTQLGYTTVSTYLTGPGGDGTCHALSSQFGSLAAAQAVYSFVSDLTQCIDWAATQKAINVAFAIGPTTNDSTPIYCTLGNYQLSNPIFIDQANNTQGSYPAWASGTTYGNNANVTYNGIPWQSMGSGNIGNPPTASNFFPAQTQLDTNDTFPIKVVTITNASPAVFTLARGAAFLNNNQPIVLMTQSYAVPGGGATPAPPSGLNTQQVYYIKNIVGNTFQVSATPGGASINTTSAGVGVFFVNGQVWQVAPVVNSTNFSNRVSFLGSPGLESNTGCRYTATSMWMNAAFYIGPHNGVLIDSVSVNHGNGGGPTPPYRCNRWHGLGQGQNSNYSFFGNHVGWQQMDNGGGSSQTKYENMGSNGFFTDMAVGYANGSLSDSNTWIKSRFGDACVGVEWMETQAFINSMYDSTVGATTNLSSGLSEGVRVIGGNYSAISGIGNSFSISSVSINGNIVTATVASPDQYLQSAMCAMNAGYVFNAIGPDYGNSNPLGSSCGYNVFTIVTPHFGVVPFYVGAFNPNTNVITLVLIPAYQNIYLGNLGVPGEVASASTLYAAEMSTTFYGTVQAENLHIESPGISTTILCNCGGFGGVKPAELKSILLNSPLARGSTVCCNQPGVSASNLAHFYAQQTVPAVTAWQGDIIIDGLVGGGDSAPDRALLASNTNVWIEGRHTQTGGPTTGTSTGGTPFFDFQADAQNNYTSIEGFTNTTLAGGYFAMNDQTFGGGTWDNPGFFLPASQKSLDIAVNNRVAQDIPSFWRTQGYGLHHNIGLRPDPQTMPCILPTQANTLAGALPPITHQSQLVFQSFLNVTAGGSGYAVNDTITLAGGTFSTAAVGQVTSIGGGGAVTGFTINQTLGVYSVQPTSFTQGLTSGGGTGATFNQPIWYVHYTISYPMLWGGQLYRLCDYKGPTAGSVGIVSGKYSVQSNNIGYSYFQNLTTTNVPNLRWTSTNNSPFIYMNQEALELMFPGLNLQLTPDGTGSCPTSLETFQVLEVHPTLGYVKTVRADSNTGPQLPGWGNFACTNNIIGQQAPNLVAPY